MIASIEQFGHATVHVIERFGRFVSFCGLAFWWLFADMVRWRRWKLVLPQLYEVGTRSIPVVALTGAFIGMVLAVELFEQFRQFGQEARIGGVISISVVRHLGPVLAAVMLAGRVGGAFAAELGTMAVTEQIDALRVMGAAPVSYLVVPRIIACFIMIPLMTIYSDLLGVWGGWLIAVRFFGVESENFWLFAAQFVTGWDIFMGMLKSVFFGVTIALICCYKGFYCGKGAQGVGRATTDAFVTSFVCIIILNFFLAMLGRELFRWIYGYEAFSAFG